MTQDLFSVVFPLAAPFWALMILLPRWRWTRRIVGSPLIAAPPAAVYAILLAPQLAAVWPIVTGPTLGDLQELLAGAGGAALAWAHFIALDLFAGRWAYLDGLERGVHPLVMAPVLLLIILLAPVGLLVYLGVRHTGRSRWRAGRRTPEGLMS